MKKLVALSLATLMMCSSVFASEISVNLNGKAVEFTSQEPVIVEGRTLIPLRGVFEELGYEISWDNASKTATFIKDNTEVKVSVNSNEFSVNGESVSLDVPAQIVNGSMMLPLRAIGEATGLEVDWDNDTKSVNLNANNINVTTEETTEVTTQNIVEETSVSSAEIEKSVKVYIEFSRAVVMSNMYISNEKNLIKNMNGYMSNEDLTDVLNNYFIGADFIINKINEIGENEYNENILKRTKTAVIDSKELFTYVYDVINDIPTSNSQNMVNAKLREYSNKVEKSTKALSEELSASTKKYKKAIENEDWSFEELTVEEARAERAYQKKVGDIIEHAFSNFNMDLNNNDFASSMRKAAEYIRTEVSKLTPPSFAAKDDDILFAGCDILNELADVSVKAKEDSPEQMYLYELFSIFDACADSCAGYYYVSPFNED